jgi:penicillin-binding protein 1A
MKRLGLKIVLVAGITAIIPLILVLIVTIRAFGILQSEKELLSYKNASASVVLSENGELIGKIFIENRTNITYEQLPKHLINALVATEDARYFKHKGIDSRSLFRVFFKTILFRNKNSGGGSTITEQLAKNMFGRKNKGPFSLFVNKTKEALLARRLEKVFTKEEIITLYLNTVPFGENVYGIDAASRRYFNKTTGTLKIEESAVLIGILKANNLYNPRLYPANAKNRRNIVLGQMQKYKYLTAVQADSLSKLPLVLNYVNLESAGPADYFLYQVKNEVSKVLQEVYTSTGKKWNVEEDGLIITTTLNLPLQMLANQSFHDHLSVMQKKLDNQYQTGSGKRFIARLAENELKRAQLTEKANEVKPRLIFGWQGTLLDSISVIDSMKNSIRMLHAGLLAMNPVTGEVRAWVGGIDFKTHPYDQILAQRQTGSTFKPVLYAEALEEGIKPCNYLDNDSIVVSGLEEWSPRNFDHSVGGKYSLTGALVHSMNIPTFNLFLKVDFIRLDTLWRRLGFSFALLNNPSVALGTAEASIGELAVAYAAFSNGGYRVTPQKLISIKSADGKVIWQNKFDAAKVRVFSSRTVILMNAILQKAVREGTGSPMSSLYGVNIPMAGKTGTSQDYGDAWFAAYNPKLVIVSRVGASLASVHFRSGSNGSGSALALPLVGLTLKNMQTSPELMDAFAGYFPPLPSELQNELDCPDFREKTAIENFMGIFKKNKIDYDHSKRKQKKNSFFRRLFGKGK